LREYLKELRYEKSKTQQDVADFAGITRQYYQMVENGERQQDISLGLLQKLSAALDVPLDELIRSENEYKQSLAKS
jgi:transcriptional regulator with XRE-family HTH domain